MKKIFFSTLFLFVFVGFSQAQTTEKDTKPAPKVEAANPAIKSCCAAKADASKKSCAKEEAQVKSCCGSVAEAGKQCCAKGEAKVETPAGQSQTKNVTAAPAARAEKVTVVAAGSTRSAVQTNDTPEVSKAVQK